VFNSQQSPIWHKVLLMLVLEMTELWDLDMLSNFWRGNLVSDRAKIWTYDSPASGFVFAAHGPLFDYLWLCFPCLGRP
jgi:hypothetical protein